MNDFTWHKKEALQEQLKFFGAKKQKFISVYAKKPRIRVEVKDEQESSIVDYAQRFLLPQDRIAAMQQNYLHDSHSGARNNLNAFNSLACGYAHSNIAHLGGHGLRGLPALGAAASLGLLDI